MSLSNEPARNNTQKEAFTHLTKNYTLLLPLLLSSLLSSSLLFSFNYLFITPLISKVSTKSISTTYSNLIFSIWKDTWDLIILSSIFLITSFIIISLLTISTVHVISTSYSDKPSTLNDMFSKIKRVSVGPTITLFYISIMYQCYTVVLETIYFFGSNSPNLIFTFVAAVLLVVVKFILWLYSAPVWSLSMVVSVVEEDCYGWKAIKKAALLFRERWREGISIGAYLMMISILMMVSDGYVNLQSVVARLAIRVVYVDLCVVMIMFVLAVSTIFYYECKRSHEERKEIEEEDRFGYDALPKTASQGN